MPLQPRAAYRASPINSVPFTLSLLAALPLALSLIATQVTAGTPDDPSVASDTAAARLDATLTLSGHLIGAGIGYKWGRGVLEYDGEERRFCIRGLSLGDVGAAKLEAHGGVFNLGSLEDFPGKYFGISTGVAIARGESAALLKNDRGVMIELESKVKGLRFSMAASGVRIILAKNDRC